MVSNMKSMKNMNAVQRPQQQGFTLIELMIVIAIVGILAAIALPAYQDYTIRARMSEVLATAAEAKTTISEFAAANGRLPATAVSAGILTSGFGAQSYVGSATFNGTIYTIRTTSAGIRFDELGGANGAGNMGVVLTPTLDPNSRRVTWTCGPVAADAAKAKFLPASCRTL